MNDSDPILSVSIVSHNSQEDLERLLPTLKRSLKMVSHEVLIVDNRSNDDSVLIVKKMFPEASVSVNAVRKGYGANHNINLLKARGKYIVFMNADIILNKDTMTLQLCFMEKQTDVGICCPNVLNEDGSLQYLNKQYPTVLDLFIRRFAFLVPDRFVEKRSVYYEMREIAYHKIIDVPFISGCFMFCRAEVIRSVGGFDEGFFLYFEDVDLCREVQKIARTVGYPKTEIIHRWERSAHKNAKWFFVFLKSSIHYFNKWGYVFK